MKNYLRSFFVLAVVLGGCSAASTIDHLDSAETNNALNRPVFAGYDFTGPRALENPLQLPACQPISPKLKAACDRANGDILTSGNCQTHLCSNPIADEAHVAGYSFKGFEIERKGDAFPQCIVAGRESSAAACDRAGGTFTRTGCTNQGICSVPIAAGETEVAGYDLEHGLKVQVRTRQEFCAALVMPDGVAEACQQVGGQAQVYFCELALCTLPVSL